MSPTTPHWPQPSHPDILEVIHVPGEYAALSKSLVSLPAGALLACLGTPPMTRAEKAYSTVQVSPTQHIELNCDFLYINHSCEPSIEFHVVRAGGGNSNGPADDEHEPFPVIEIRVSACRALRKGDELTFFYPSTEWVMAQPFECNCGAKTCRGRITGANDMSSASLQGEFLNEHVRRLQMEQAGDARRESSARALAGEMGGDTKSSTVT